MGWLLLAIVVIAATAIWPLGRWTLGTNGDSAATGFWVSLTVAGISAVISAFTEEAHAVPAVWLAGLAMGSAYALGFWICTMRALQIGPAGPTVTINNMAMVCGVLYSVLVLATGRLNGWMVTGLAGTCMALLLLGWNQTPENGTPRVTGSRWARLIAAGGMLSCVSFVAQTHVGTLYPGHKYLFGASAFGSAAIILLPWMMCQPSRFFLRRERTGGLLLGLINAVILPLSLLTIHLLGAEVALPVTVATPILLMLILGKVFYREHLRPATWIACLLGAVSVALLAYGKAGC